VLWRIVVLDEKCSPFFTNIRLILVRSVLRVLVFVVVVAVAGCATFEAHEYRISRAGRSDIARVQRILQNIASETAIPRSTPTPADSPTIALYRDSSVQLRASVSGSDVRVFVARYDWPPPSAFTQADRRLVQALSAAFGSRFGVEPPADVERTIVVY
jgi:hypothetical protein